LHEAPAVLPRLVERPAGVRQRAGRRCERCDPDAGSGLFFQENRGLFYTKISVLDRPSSIP
jgi:hypothetical protein